MKKVSIVRNDFYLSKFVFDGNSHEKHTIVSNFKSKTKLAALKRFYIIFRSILSSHKEDKESLLIYFAMEDILALDHYSKNHSVEKALWLWNPVSSMSAKRRVFLLWYCKVNKIKIWTFDKADAAEFGFQYHPQVLRFLNSDEEENLTFNAEKHRVFFSGVDKGRLYFLKNVQQELTNMDIEFDCHLIKDKRKSYKKEELTLFSESYISYDEYLLRASKATCLLEVSQGEQEGLTTRALEALFLNKKLLTKNKDIVNYDFYHEHNVYVLGVDTRSIRDFLNVPLVTIADEVKKQYTIDHLLTSIMKEGVK